MTKTTKSGPKHIKNPLKTHIEAPKIQKIPRGGPQNPPYQRGNNLLSRALPPLVPSALDGFLRRATFKYAETALIVDG